MRVEGFYAPVRRSLTQPLQIGGAPREFAILNGTIMTALVLGMGSLIALPVGLLIHAAVVALAKRDPHCMDTFRRHIQQKPYYEA